MKYLVPSLLLIFAACAIQKLPPAGPSSEAMTKANVILVQTHDSPTQTFETMKKILHDQGYSLQASNDRELELNTTYKTYGKSNIKLMTDIIESDSSSIVEITGMVKVPEFQYRQEYGGGKPSTTNRIKNKNGSYNPAWEIMQAIARKYPDGILKYERRQS